MDSCSNPKFVLGGIVLVIFILGLGVSIASWMTVLPTIGQAINLASSVVLFALSTACVIRSKAEFNLLRWPYALWCSSAAVGFGVIASRKHPESVTLGWLLATPMLLIAIYSYGQSRKPNGGKQLDLPVDLVHFFKRMEWKWLTPPKLDFWPCWIGLLFPVALGVGLFIFNWNVPVNPWLATLKIGGVASFFLFLVRWTTAPKDFKHYNQLTNSIWLLRVTGITYYFSLGLSNVDITSWGAISGKIYSVSLLVFCTGFFESAYRRSIERQTPLGIAEYEAIEGPSLGL